MNPKHTLIKQIIKVAGGDTLAKIILFIIHIKIINTLNASNYSIFSLAFTAILMSYQLICAPIERIYITQNNENKEIPKGHTIALWTIACILASIWLAKDTPYSTILVTVACISALSIQQIQRIKLQKESKFTQLTTSEIIKNTIWITIIWLWPLEKSVNTILIGLIISAAIAAAMTTTPSKSTSNTPKDKASLPSDIKRNYSIICYSIVGAAIPYTSIFIAKNNLGETEIAAYGAAIRYQGALNIISQAANIVLLPTMAQDDHSNKQEISKTIILLTTAFLLATVLMFFAIEVFDGNKFIYTQDIFLLLAVTTLFSIITTPYINRLLINGRSRTILRIMLIGLTPSLLAVIIGKATLLQDTYTAAILSILTYATILILTYIYSRKK